PIARKVVQSFKAIPARGDESVDLSPHEHSVLNGLAEGLAYKQIADQLGVSIHTVRNYIRRRYEKLHVRPFAIGVKLFAGITFWLISLAGVQAGDTNGWHPGQAQLMTRWAAEVSPTNVWPEYPRPQ